MGRLGVLTIIQTMKHMAKMVQTLKSMTNTRDGVETAEELKFTPGGYSATYRSCCP